MCGLGKTLNTSNEDVVGFLKNNNHQLVSEFIINSFYTWNCLVKPCQDTSWEVIHMSCWKRSLSFYCLMFQWKMKGTKLTTEGRKHSVLCFLWFWCSMIFILMFYLVFPCFWRSNNLTIFLHLTFTGDPFVIVVTGPLLRTGIWFSLML